MTNWIDEFRGAVTLCDRDAKIIYMNDKSAFTFSKWGGRELIGKSLLDCHSVNSTEQIKSILQNGGENIYTIEKNGKKKLIYQAATRENEEITGIVELSIELPADMPHHIRD